MHKEDVVHMYNGLWTTKKEQNNAICINMDERRDYHIKWSKSKTDIIWYPLYVESLKKRYKWTYLQNINRLTNIEKLMVIKGERGEG